ncbi:MAG: ATP-binding protein [Candidatus Riflebacteria bacterium HGW-Riflebacteria-2]|jgi:hypothetical protein|nr:MAG: ATP-binding protein [Candidatus Riflebacteria bacterium HGW-Riflebacteria-2]
MSGDNVYNLLPSPAALIESLRAIGYSTETSIADIIDNSITAKSTLIDIFFEWNNGQPWVLIVDNGCGMSREELISAMRFGSQSPNTFRSDDDLGRFGLGMKTASFSQCRKLLVVSWQKGITNAAEWDLDWLIAEQANNWNLRLPTLEEISHYEPVRRTLAEKQTCKNEGTLIFWHKLDKFELAGADNNEDAFDETMASVRKHLELVFHRFLENNLKKNRLKICMNNSDLVPFNPFCTGNNATQELPKQDFLIGGERVEVQPYVLPHHNKISKQEWDRFAGQEGYLHNQGFYVYRNRRLIIKGTWFKLLKKEELNKLIRVRVDISNKLDHLWNIDVKKSKATPPESIKRELKKIINRIEVAGRKVYRQRGQTLRTSLIPLWNRRVANGQIFFEINQEHPVLQSFIKHLSPERTNEFEACLNAIESAFPVDTIYHDYASAPEELQKTGLSENNLYLLLDRYIMYAKESGRVDFNELKDMEIFAGNSDLVKKYLEERHDIII